MVYQIPLRNKEKEIIDYALVSEEDFDRVMQYKWHLYQRKDGKKYVAGYIHKNIQNLKLHHFIAGKPIKGYVIDHIDGNGLNNCRENLRHVTYALNSQNKENVPSLNSIYRGVSFVKKVNRWRAAASDTHIGHYLTDKKAAEAYDKFVLVKHGSGACTNGLINYEEVQDMTLEDVLAQKRKKELPKNISKYKQYYRVRFTYEKKEKTVAYCKTLKEAELVLAKYKITVIQPQIEAKIQQHNSQKITRNDKGEAIILIKNRMGVKLECIVDDDNWYYLMNYSWSFNKMKYVFSYIDGKRRSMHKYLLKIPEDKKVDHINRRPYDNRKSNLRSATNSQNGHNKTKRTGTSSQYTGVSLSHKKWRAYITKDRVRYNLGGFAKETDAARAYNTKAIELYGNYANLNVISDD